MFSEEALRNAAIELGLALANGTPEAERCDHGFSRHFIRRMNRLIRQTRHPSLYRSLKSAACLLLALLLSGMVWLSVDAQARESFFGWVFHWSYEGGNELARCMPKLPARDREFLLLKYAYGYENRELALFFHLSKEAVYKLDQRARGKLLVLWNEVT